MAAPEGENRDSSGSRERERVHPVNRHELTV